MSDWLRESKPETLRALELGVEWGLPSQFSARLVPHTY
jgi:hypothetical protein